MAAAAGEPNEQERGADFVARYRAALRAFLDEGGEAALQRAYELGREASASGRGVLSTLAAHLADASAGRPSVASSNP